VFQTTKSFKQFWGNNPAAWPKVMRELTDFRNHISRIVAQRKNAKAAAAAAVQDNIRAIREDHLEAKQAVRDSKKQRVRIFSLVPV
jgi:predicted component of type VI protein secretion system